MGRPATPTAVLALRGSWRAKARPHEPQVKAALPPAPSWLSPTAKREWKKLARELAPLGMLTEIDQAAFALFAEALGQYLEAKEMIYGNPKKGMQGTGLITMTQHGSETIHPAVRIMQDAWMRALRAAREFGLTPAARRSVTAAPRVTDASDSKTKFFRQA